MVVLARSHWRSVVGGRSAIFFLDNIAALRVSIKGSSGLCMAKTFVAL